MDLKKPNTTFSQVAENNHISVTSAQNIFDSFVHPPKQHLTEVLCFDEVHTKAGSMNKYSFLILDFQTHNLLEIYPDRRKYFLINELEKFPEKERLNVKYIIMDMYEPYHIVARRKFPNAKRVVDPFHVIKNLNDKLDEVRLRVMKEYQPGSEEYYLLKKFKWMLFKASVYPSPAKYNRRLRRYISYDQILEEILKLSNDLREAYYLKTSYQFFNKYTSANEAEEEMDKILEEFKDTEIPEMQSAYKMLKRWKAEIINSFTKFKGDRLSNGIMESRNKLVQQIKGNGNGYTNFERFRNRCLYVMNSNVTVNLGGTGK